MIRNIFLILLFIPFLGFSQKKYNLKSRKTYKQAQESLKNGNKSEAMILFKQCVSEEPQYIEAFHNMSVIEFDNKNYKKSISYSNQVLDLNKTKAPVYLQMAKSYFMLENYDSSIYYSKIATVLNSKSDEAFYILAKSENNIKKYEKALNHINKAVEINPNESDYYNVRGVAYFGIEDYDNALKDFKQVLALNPNNTGVYKNIANVYIAKGEAAKAIEYIDKGILDSKGQDKVQYLILKGNYYHSIGKLDDARAAFLEAQKINNQSPVVLTNLAAVLIDKGEFESAVENCTKAIEIDPTLTEAYFNRGIANEMLRKTDEACSDWEEAFILGAVKAEDYLNSPTCNE
jgi:tetratricopeptide (TPR) repeat protein